MRGIVLTSVFAVVVGMGLVGCAPDGTTARAEELRASCDGIGCPIPLCAQGQHLFYSGSCCPTCVGPTSHCAGIACPMYLCAIGEHLVTHNGECCGRCEPIRPIAECATDSDCPVFECFACPCPTSSCRGHQCVTSTPAASTCSTGI